MPENVTTRTFTLPDSYLAALESEAVKADMSIDKTLAAAIRLYQFANLKARRGERMAFVDALGQLVREPVFGIPEID